MFCINCGSKMESDAKFCTSCGTAVESAAEPMAESTPTVADVAAEPPSPTYEQPTYAPPPEYAQPMPNAHDYPAYGQPPQHPQYSQSPYPAYGHAYPPPPTKGTAWWKIALIIAIPVVLIAAIVVGAIALFGGRSSATQLHRAMDNLTVEMMERIDSTPLGVLPMMIEALDSGTTTLKVDYETFGWWETYTQAEITIKTNSQDSEYAVIMDIASDSMDFDLELFLNDERIAARSQLLGDDFFGITFDTLSADIQTFGNSIGLDRTAMNELTQVAEMIEDLLNMQDLDEEFIESIEKVFEDFAENLEESTERVEIRVSGETVNATRIYYVIQFDDVVDLLRELVNLYEDFYFRQIEIFNNPASRDVYLEMSRSFDDMMFEIDYLLRELERNSYGEITTAFYLGNRDRLLRMHIEADLTVDGDRGQLTMVYDFGLSATDRWEFEITTIAGRDEYSIFITWDYSERGNSHVNTIRVDVIDRWSDYSVTLMSEWNKTSGDFELSAQISDGPVFGGGAVSGNLTMTNTGFALVFDDIETSFSRVSFEISGELGAPNIENVDFINLDRWGDTLVDLLEDLFFGGFPFGGFGVADDPWVEPPPAPPPADPPPEPAPVVEPDPLPPAGEIDIDENLIGRWAFESGDYIWFFGTDSEIEFFEDGTIRNHTRNRTAEIISTSMFEFTIRDDAGRTFEFFFFYLGDNTLAIEDEDFDLAFFERIQ